MQDGASSHTAQTVVSYLDTYLGKRRWIRDWPPLSPDLNPLDFGIWSILKTKVGERGPKSPPDLKAFIMQEVKNLSVETVRKCAGELPRRLECMVERKGGRVWIHDGGENRPQRLRIYFCDYRFFSAGTYGPPNLHVQISPYFS